VPPAYHSNEPRPRFPYSSRLRNADISNPEPVHPDREDRPQRPACDSFTPAVVGTGAPLSPTNRWSTATGWAGESAEPASASTAGPGRRVGTRPRSSAGARRAPPPGSRRPRGAPVCTVAPRTHVSSLWVPFSTAALVVRVGGPLPLRQDACAAPPGTRSSGSARSPATSAPLSVSTRSISAADSASVPLSSSAASRWVVPTVGEP